METKRRAIAQETRTIDAKRRHREAHRESAMTPSLRLAPIIWLIAAALGVLVVDSCREAA
jgi:hypothetical protein